MTAQLVKNMSDSDLLDMHYFLTEDEYFDGEEEGFYLNIYRLFVEPSLIRAFILVFSPKGEIS